MKKSFIVFFFLFLSVEVFAQYSVTGFVFEEDEKTPVAGAQIFIDGSTIGTLSLEDGSFELEQIPEGVHDLVVRFVGFEGAMIQISTNQLQESYTFFLKEIVYELDELTVKPDRKNWEQDFSLFKKYFIGEGPFSEKTILQNKDDIYFDYNVEERTLTAITTAPLEIRNGDLGYVLRFYLDHFIFDYKSNSTSFSGQAFFTELESRRKRTRNNWTVNRETAYKGSFLHFTKSLIAGAMEDEGFVATTERRDDEAIYRSNQRVEQSYFFDAIDNSAYSFSFTDFLNVTYLNEYEDITYLNSKITPFTRNPRLLAEPQNSSFTLAVDSVLVDESGFILTPNTIIFDGYWGFEKISDMLPIDYSSASKEN